MSYAKTSITARGLSLPSIALLGSIAVVAGCCASASDPGNPSANPANTGGTTGVGTGGSSSGGTADPSTCVQGIPITTQIPRMLNRQYGNVVRDLLGVTTIDGKSVADSLVGDFMGAMTAPAWAVYQDVAAKIAAQVMSGPTKAQFISCEPAAAGCLNTTIKTFGRKAFRRALTDEEVASFETLGKVTPAGTPTEVAEATLNAFLVSPSFILIPELNTEVEGTAIKLSQQEMATRLSFLLWGSVPDDALNAAADASQLSTKEQILAQAQRMIAVRAKTGQLVSAFHDDWAQMNNSSAHWYQGDHDPAKYPTYATTAKATYAKEMDAFFEEVAYSNGSFQDLLTSNVAFVNSDNAAIYGLDPSQYTAMLTKVTLSNPDQPRPGFLTRAGFLSSYSDYSSSSPILRGAFIASWLLNTNPGAPDPNAKKATVTGTFTTQRQYVEALTEKMQPCQGCHTVFNGFGYVLEHYDGIGKWQTTDLRGGAIDDTVTTANIGFDGQPAKPISTPVQMMQEIAKSTKAQEAYAKAWVSYAYGRAPNANDQCVVDTLKMSLNGSGYSILALLGDLTQTDSFRLRVRGPNM